MTEIRFRSDIGVRLVQHVGGDSAVIASAKVSVEGPAAESHRDGDAGSGLIRYLMKQRHGTPFEHASMTFLIEAPILVYREWHRHRIGWSYNEESGRYKQLEPVFYLPPRDRPMIKVDGWKPGRPKFKTLDEESAASRPGWHPIDHELMGTGKYNEIVADMKAGYADEYARYERQLARGLDPGLARDNLPVGIYSSMYATCNPRSLMSFLSLRTCDESAKFVSYPLYEIEQAARQCEAEFARLFPITHAAFNEFGRVCP